MWFAGAQSASWRYAQSICSPAAELLVHRPHPGSCAIDTLQDEDKGAAELSSQVKDECKQRQAAAGPGQYRIMGIPALHMLYPLRSWAQDHSPARALSRRLFPWYFQSGQQGDKSGLCQCIIPIASNQQLSPLHSGSQQSAAKQRADAVCLSHPVLLLWLREGPTSANGSGPA